MNTGRDNKLWLQSWRDERTDFHQSSVNSLLARFWPLMNLPQGCRIFVPLCGKSLDMIWLARQGHQVVGVELSQIAVKAFFHENKLTPSVRPQGSFSLWSHGNISIYCGDYFALSKKIIGHVDTVYDRAALTALDEDIRIRYVEQLRAIVSTEANIFLLTTEDCDNEYRSDELSGVDSEIESLYAARFQIELVHAEREAQPSAGVFASMSECKVYQLSAR